jgi:creatinine amidohydrolase
VSAAESVRPSNPDHPDSEAVRREHRYEALTWPEINVAVEQGKVVVLPVAAIEQHGHHLPLDVDNRLVTAVCLEAGARSPDDVLIMPPVHYGFCHHVMDYPGTVTIEPSTFTRYLVDIGRSVAHHGFSRMIVVNGHGSNAPLVEMAGRQLNLQTEMRCATLSWWQLVADYWNREVRESTAPGGCAHACELETSMYMHLNGEGVRWDRIEGAIPQYMTDIPGADEWHWIDLTAGWGPATIVEWTASYSETGALGQPEFATAEKGSRVFDHAADRLVALARWFRARPVFPRRPRQVGEARQLPFGF